MRQDFAPHQIDRFWASDWSLKVLLVLLVLFIFFIHPLNLGGYDTRLVAAVAFSVILLSPSAVIVDARRRRAATSPLRFGPRAAAVVERP